MNVEIKKPPPEEQKYPVRPQNLVKRIFTEELRKHIGKSKDECIEYMKEKGLLPEHLRE